MEIVTKEELNLIERQLYNKGRDIDVAVFNALMDAQNRDFVLDCLMLYMNKDGGFGSGLMIDNYNPNSSVYQTYEAFRIMDSIGLSKACDNPLFTEIVNKACNYLFNKCCLEEGAWNPAVPTNNDFAHSEEMSYHRDFIPVFGYFPTAAILGYIFTFLDDKKAYYKKALKQVGYAIDYFKQKKTYSVYDFIGLNSLLGSLRKNQLFLEEQQLLEQQLCQQAKLRLEDPSFSVPRMLYHCSLDEELLEKCNHQLDELITSRKSHGLWEHEENWGTSVYPEADSAALKWIGAETVQVIALLKHYGRIKL